MAMKILLADDEEDVKDVLRMFLESKGFEVVTAFDGLSAIDTVRQERPDLVLLDIMMPSIDGIEVCKKLKADPQTVNIPIVMISASSHAESVQKGLDAGAVEYIVKPFEPKNVLAMIQRILNP